MDSSASATSAGLFVGKIFSNWESCDSYMLEFGKVEGFGIIKDRVRKDGDSIIRKRTYICEHGKKYNSKSNRDTSTKKMNCPWHSNVSCNNPDSTIIVTKVVDEHNHGLNIEAIAFRDEKKFNNEMMEDIRFLTIHCKLGATAQRRYLEAKYPLQPIYSMELYASIAKFRPTKKSLSNDAAMTSNWLDEQKEIDPRWVVARGWDDDHTLTHLFWMTPRQVEDWLQYSDCVINDVTHKTNRYGMALSIFVGFDRHMKNTILAQGLLIDESKQSHTWLFKQIIEATGVYPTVILTDSDPAVDSAVREAFPATYPIHCAFHITQNLHKNLRKPLGDDYGRFLQDFYYCRNSLVQKSFERLFAKLIEDYPQGRSYLEMLYETRSYWAHTHTGFRFTGGMIASSRVESVNACIKRMLFNSDVSLCELMKEIHKLLDEQDKNNRYQYWKLAIPSVKNQEKVNFLFTSVDKSCQNFLTPAVLKLQRDEINQSLYYTASIIEQWDTTVDESCEEECADSLQATMEQLLEVGGRENIKEMWELKVGNSLKTKHYVVLLKNGAHLCSCLMAIRWGIICRHYFQVMLCTAEAKFHIRLIPSRWYQEGKTALYEPFIVAEKFNNASIPVEISVTNYLGAINKEKEDSLEQRMNLLETKMMYGNLHGVYKKALQKALQKKSDSLRLVKILEDFIEDNNNENDKSEELTDEELSENSDESDKENTNVFSLQNPKIRRGKGRPAGTRRFKSSHEKENCKPKQQRRCKKCGNLGHYQKNCNV